MAINRSARIPFAVSDSVRLSYVAASFAGAQAQFDSAKFKNTYRVPIEVSVIRVLIVPLPSELITGDLRPIPFIRLEAKLGNDYMTDGPVPVSVLAPYRIWEETLEDYPRTNDFSEISMRSIFLPRPLFLKPGSGFNLIASIPNDEFTASFPTDFDVDVYVSIIGRFLAPGDKIPEMHHVPMVSFVQLSQGTKRVSVETDLRNPLTKTIQVHRLVGSRPRARALASEELIDAWENDGGGSFYVPTELDVRFPDGTAMTEIPIAFEHVFGQLRTWPAPFELGPNERIRAQINRNTGEPARCGYQIALFATRPEVVR